ncbi:hypothetical protein ANDA3_2636 [plant metagenome]|uniref:Uncharacterized protein n=1 Tax=plant metagenome TaxID=1297885 RepID=A0A484Q1X8_9ZZZZ
MRGHGQCGLEKGLGGILLAVLHGYLANSRPKWRLSPFWTRRAGTGAGWAEVLPQRYVASPQRHIVSCGLGSGPAR